MPGYACSALVLVGRCKFKLRHVPRKKIGEFPEFLRCYIRGIYSLNKYFVLVFGVGSQNGSRHLVRTNVKSTRASAARLIRLSALGMLSASPLQVRLGLLP